MRVAKAAGVQLSPVLYSREGTVEKVVRKIHELGQLGVQFATARGINWHIGPAVRQALCAPPARRLTRKYGSARSGG